MRPLGNPYAVSCEHDEGVLHTWLAFGVGTPCALAFHQAELALEADAEQLGALIVGPVVCEAFRPQDPGVPEAVLQAFALLPGVVGLLHGFAAAERRNTARTGREAPASAPVAGGGPGSTGPQAREGHLPRRDQPTEPRGPTP